MNMVEKKDVAWSPSSCTKACCEHLFGQVKKGIGHNVPSLKAFLLSLRRVHHGQRQRGYFHAPEATWDSSSLSEMDVMSIARRARLAACAMFPALNVGDSAEEVSERLEAWWPDEGRSLLLRRGVDGSAEEAMEAAVDDGSSSESEWQQLQELIPYAFHLLKP